MVRPYSKLSFQKLKGTCIFRIIDKGYSNILFLDGSITGSKVEKAENGQSLAGQRLAHYCTRENPQSLKRSEYPFYRQYHLAAAYDPELIDNFEVRDQ